VSFISIIVSFATAGKEILNICGITILNLVCISEMPKTFAASYWPLSTERRPPLNISAKYAA